MHRRAAEVLVAFVCYLGFTASAGAAPFYWTDPGSFAVGTDLVRRANSDGSGMQTILSGLEEPRGMALDLSRGKLYVVEPGALAIKRTNLDGTELVTFAPTHDGAADVAVDTTHGKAYWTDSDSQQIAIGALGGQVMAANVDGSGVQVIAGGMIHPGGIAVDEAHGKVYWTELAGHFDGNGSIQRSNLDGSNLETILSGIDEANGLAIDPIAGKLYWPELRGHKIQSANLDGSSLADVLTGLDNPAQIDLSLSEGKMYWTNGGGQTPNAIFRSNLDGTGVETLISGVGFPFGIAVVPEPSSVVLLGLSTVSMLVAGRRRFRKRVSPASSLK
jgi:DNA-binding beta-propeller fold protein YncE